MICIMYLPNDMYHVEHAPKPALLFCNPYCAALRLRRDPHTAMMYAHHHRPLYFGLVIALIAYSTPTASFHRHLVRISNSQHEQQSLNSNHKHPLAWETGLHFVTGSSRSRHRARRRRSLDELATTPGGEHPDGIDSEGEIGPRPSRGGHARSLLSTYSRGARRGIETCDDVNDDSRGIAPLMSRSRAVTSIFSSLLTIIGAGVLGSAGFIGTEATAADAAAVAEDRGVTDSADSATPDASEKRSYVMGVDEFGVLFGDGPIGIKLGDNPLKASGICRVFVTEIIEKSQAVRNPSLHAGLGVSAVNGIPTAALEPKQVAELIKVSTRPMEIIFRDPEKLGQRLQAEAEKRTGEMKRKRQTADVEKTTAPSPSRDSPGELRVTQVGEKPKVCGTRSKAGDLIEFRYSARLASDMSVEFDSSDRRGTGLPYAIVLGNGDVVKGLDLSLFDMCVGERRRIEIPARLAYGKKGSKLFGIPPEDGTGSGTIVYGVELVSINFNTDASDKRDNFYVDDPCDAAAIAAGNASGKCEERSSPASAQ